MTSKQGAKIEALLSVFVAPKRIGMKEITDGGGGREGGASVILVI